MNEDAEIEAMARAMADVHREFEGNPPFTDEEWGEAFWLWYQRCKGHADERSFVHRSWPAKLERQAKAARGASSAHMELATAKGRITDLRRALVEAVLPLQALRLSGSVDRLSPDLAQAVVDGIAALDKALAATGGGE